MTYGWVPRNWDAFARELAERGITPGSIEKIELRPAAGAPAGTDVVVTTRSGEVHAWRHDAQPAAGRLTD